MKVKLSATVPVVQYGNLVPEVEVEADTYEEGMAEAEAYIKSFWNKYVESGKELRGAQGKKLKAFVGGEIWYDDISHTYTNDAGEVYLSGSQYAKQFEKPFDKEKIAGAIAKKFEVSASEVIDMWELKAEVSNCFGTAVHAALQLYEQYGVLAKAIEKETHLHTQSDIKRIVQSFMDGRGGDKVMCEALVVDHATKRAGRIDRLKHEDDGSFRVQDYKTNGELDKSKIDLYWRQLSFYAAIIQAGGYEVSGLDIFHYNGSEWVTYTSKVLEV